jgi:hypothetical protein
MTTAGKFALFAASVGAIVAIYYVPARAAFEDGLGGSGVCWGWGCP